MPKMTTTPRIYLDCCVLSRLTDRQDSERIRQETAAIRIILKRIESGNIAWIASSLLEAELRRNPNQPSREAALALLLSATEKQVPDRGVGGRAKIFRMLGYGAFDALHLAMAEHSNCAWLITTDDGFLSKVNRKIGLPSVKAANPIEWLKTVKP